MHQIRAVSLTAYLDVATELGLDGRALLAEAEIDLNDLSDPETRLPAAAVANLLEEFARRSGCDILGLLMAQRRTFASLGPLSLLLQYLPTVRDAIETFISDMDHSSEILELGLVKDHGTALFTVNLLPPFNKPQLMDKTVGMAYRTLSAVSKGGWRPEVVHFTHEAPTDPGHFARFFQSPVEFGCTFTGFSFPEQHLAITLPLADPAMEVNVRRLLRKAHPYPRIRSTADRVRSVLIALLHSQRATLKTVASKLGLDSRSLQRQLAREDARFSELLNEVKRQLAQDLLSKSRLPVTDVAANLGYPVAGSFTRWFRSEFGTSPLTWRHKQWRFEREID